jgi:NAD(P)-dependent dehydrogenase (short-subunit alcohol dehydrogenase family)
MNRGSLAGKVSIVTGGASGIGAATVRAFAAEGAIVYAVDLDAPGAERLAAELRETGADVTGLGLDVTLSSAVDAAFRSVIERSGRVDALVNSAGVAHVGTLLDTSESDLDRLYAVNVKGTINACRAAVREMIGQGGGTIVNLASIASVIGLTDRFAYTMTKGAVHALTRSIAVDYMKQGVRCNCICPTRVHTPFVDGFIKRNYPGREAEMFQKLSEYQPMGRMAKPEEVAAMALFLSTDASSFITGHAMPVDGGVLIQ